MAGLELPPRVEISFDPSGRSCGRAAGVAHPDHGPPAVWVCRRTGPTFAATLAARVTLLHELAHLWHWRLGDGSDWPEPDVVGDSSSIALPAHRDANDDTEEAVATAISWGLLDQLRRPVGSDLPCSLLYEQYTALTGRAPLGPIERVCFPAPGPLVTGGP